MEIELTNQRVVAIDGGTATGKGRLIDELAQLLRLKGLPVIHLSTGSLYRAVAYAAIDSAKGRVPAKRGKSADEISRAALELIRTMDGEQFLEIARPRQIQMHGGVVWIDGAPASIDDQLKATAVGTGASIVGGHLEVREFVNDLTRRQINEFNGYLLIDGRDITHTVVPDAPLKLLLSVSPQTAALRSREHTLEEIIARDKADRGHKHGALRHPDDPGLGVIVLTTDDHTPETLRDHVYELMRKVFPELPIAS